MQALKQESRTNLLYLISYNVAYKEWLIVLLTLCLTGGTMSVVLDLSYTVCIWISAGVAIIYTLLGGLCSVAYTDVIQLVLIFVSLVSVFNLLF